MEDLLTQEQLKHLQRCDTFHVMFGQSIVIRYIQQLQNE